MRLDKQENLFGSWQEAKSRILHGHAQRNMAHFKTILAGDPGSAVGVAYTSTDEKYTALVSGVSGTVTDPVAALDVVFDGLYKLTDIKPTSPGPLGGEARCGGGKTDGVNFDVCAWADKHTIGSVTLIGYPDGHDPAPQFLLVRTQLEHPAP
ncbi:hypothetical protein [Micromonospora sp. L32]|uniref:hypothetical protein n=1 Tax=unclassified Micromonospora TaxID=2617518 RepID=UPI003F8C3443